MNFASEAALPQAAGGRAGGTMLSPGDISDGREQLRPQSSSTKVTTLDSFG